VADIVHLFAAVKGRAISPSAEEAEAQSLETKAYGDPVNPFIHAFLDESGTLADMKVVDFAGSVAGGSEWQAVGSNKWMALIHDKEKYISMKDAMNFHNEFANWKDGVDEGDELLENLAEMAMDNIHC
jgi:hypothetical protein